MSIENKLQHINKIISAGKNYGRSNYGNDKKINIGYLSCDTNSINDIRNFIYGDMISNIMSFAGYDVTRQCYCTDSNWRERKKELDNIRVSLDIISLEEKLYSDGIVDNVLSSLQRSDKCYIKDNCLWLRTTDLYDSTDRLLVDDNGIYSSFLLYLSYHINRMSKGYDKVIDIISNSNEYLDGIKSGIEYIGYDSSKFEIIDINSSRENYEFNLNEILNNISINNLRYYLIDDKLDFEVVKKDSMDNPIYYIEKCYSNICLLLRGKSYEIKDIYSTIDSDIAYTILNKLTEFENIIIDSTKKRLPNMIVTYLYDLASLFNNCDICDNNEELLMIHAIRIVMDNASNMLGLILREEI